MRGIQSATRLASAEGLGAAAGLETGSVVAVGAGRLAILGRVRAGATEGR